MSRTLLKTDYISVIGEIHTSNGCPTQIVGTEEEILQPEPSYYIKLTFNILVNGKLKVWGTTYDLVKGSLYPEDSNKSNPLVLKDYHAWYDIIDFLKTIGYEIPEEANIRNWVDQFQID